MWPTQVRCAIGSIEVSCAIRRVMATVRSRVVPPAPYVTETKVGRNGSSSLIDCHRTRSPSSSLGGKNSKENERSPSLSNAPMSRALGFAHAGILGRAPSLARIRPRPRLVAMTTAEARAQVWDPDGFRSRLQAVLDVFLAEQGERLAPLGPDALRLHQEACRAVSGGKRFRAAFCYWGFRAVRAHRPRAGHEDWLLRACAALEILHASALAHDDYMDASDTRRGRPSTHRAFEAEHRDAGWAGDPEQYGAAAAILLGDLLLSWADELLRRVRLPADRRWRRRSTSSTGAAPR